MADTGSTHATYTAILPPPAALGAPDKFGDWRLQQDVAVSVAAHTTKRFSMLVVPTGGGKSLIYMMLAKLLGVRACVLTRTKALQRQLEADFAAMGDLGIVQGMNAYPCRALMAGGELEDLFAGTGGETRRGPADGSSVKAPPCHVGPCLSGVPCSMKESGCAYYDAVRAAGDSQIVVTNYAYWMHQRGGQTAQKRAGIGTFDLLILDEAHEAPAALSEFLTVELDPSLVRQKLNVELLDGEPDPEQWVTWAQHHHPAAVAMHDRLAQEVKEAKDAGRKVSRATLDEVRVLRGLVETFVVIGGLDSTWVIRYDAFAKVWKFTPLWPAKQAESVLFRGIGRVMLTSATVRQKTAALLGIKTADLEVREFPSSFPAERRPVIHVPTVRVTHRMDATEQLQWLARIDQILKARPDRKGIIHTVSYERARLIISRSKLAARLIGHSSEGTRSALERYLRANRDDGPVLVSPSMTTGYDFPYEQCEFQIIVKIPFPDTRDPVLKARTEQDADYGMYVAMQTLVQMAGRGMRAPDDQCETFIIDDQIKWFLGKYKHLAPDWFVRSVKTCATFPVAPARLPVSSIPGRQTTVADISAEE